MMHDRPDDDPADRTAEGAPPGADRSPNGEVAPPGADRSPNGEVAPPAGATPGELHHDAVAHPERERVRMDEEDGGQPPHQEGERRHRRDR